MTGIRSWTADVTAFGVVVRIEQVLIQLLLGSFQRSHNPANANNSPSLTSKQYGCLVFPVRTLHVATTRKTRLRGSGSGEISTHRGRRASWLPFLIWR